MKKSSLMSSVSPTYDGMRLEIEYVATRELRAPPRLLRDHTQRQLKQLGKSLRDFGAIVPAVIDRHNAVIVGVAIIEAALQIGLTHFPVIRITHLSDAQLGLFRIAHNKLTEGGSWNVDALRMEFAEISIAAPDLDLGSSGFSIAERDIIYGNHRVAEMVDLDEHPASPAGPPVSRLGDRFKLGRHDLLCGDSTDPSTIARAVAGRQIRTVISDPPYNVKIGGNVSGLGKKRHSEFAMATGEMPRGEFVTFLTSAIGAVQPHLVDGALLYLCMDWRHVPDLVEAAEAARLDYVNQLVWAKTNAAMGSFYRSAHEMICLFKHGTALHTNNVELGRHGRNRTNVIHMPGVNSFGKGRSKALELHPTVKPVGLMADLILDSSGPGEVIADMFGGSGSTLVAAEKTDRVATIVEYEPKFVDIICRRYEALTGEAPIHIETGLTLDALGKSRGGEIR